MDGRGALKTEDGIDPVTSFTDTIPASWVLSDVAFDFYGEAQRGPYSLPTPSPSSSSMGFMELLGVLDFGPSSLLDSAEAPDVQGTATAAGAAAPTASVPPSPTASTQPESSSEVVNNLPTTPNSSSVSSPWNEALKKELKDHALEHEEEDHETKTQKQLKARKGNKKRQQREARVAFMTKSEVDHLEDGYRWRKYGQKAVKNSPFPRSYYRCTNAICNVKKRVERSFSDPTIVVTTYEGHHTHPSPNNILRDTSHAAILSDSAAAALFATPTTAALLPHHYCNINLQHPRRPQPHFNALLSPLNAAAYKASPVAAATPASVYLGDHGLLQDVVPSTTMGKERN